MSKRRVLCLFVIMMIGLCIAGFFLYIYFSPFLDGGGLVAEAGDDQTVTINSTVIFNASQSGRGMIGVTTPSLYHTVIFLWDFDIRDGICVDAVGMTVNHTYTTPGVYTVTLILIYGTSEIATDTVTVTVVE